MAFNFTVELEELTLDNMSPVLSSQVADLLTRIAKAFQDESEHLDPEVRKASITVKIKLEHKLENRTTSVVTSIEGKLPGYRNVANVVRLPHGGDRFLIEKEDGDQHDMFSPKPKTDGEIQ